MKGWTLYGWQETGDEYFTIIFGTNRLKTAEEIVSDEDLIDENGDWYKIKVRGLDALKQLLWKLPEDDFTCLLGVPEGYEPVSAETREALKDYCRAHELGDQHF